MTERAQIRALAHLALFYKKPEDVQRYDKTISSFDRLIDLAKKQNHPDILDYAQKERSSLENWRPIS